MKRNTSIWILIFMSFSLQAQNTIDFNKEWNVVDYEPFSPNISSFQFSLLKDTLINGNQYFELFQRNDTLDTTQWTSTNSFLREDSSHRIYVLENGNESLLYDFNLEVNDTFQLDYNNTNCELLVHQVDSVQLANGELRKRIRLIRSDDPNPEQPWYGYKVWIQGIGSTTSLLSYGESCFTDYGFDLLCYFENDIILYSNSESEGCFITPVTELLSDPSISIFPNPANSVVFIDSEIKPNSVSLISSNGKLLQKSYSRTLQVDKVAAGIYIIQLAFGDKLLTQKIIIN